MLKCQELSAPHCLKTLLFFNFAVVLRITAKSRSCTCRKCDVHPRETFVCNEKAEHYVLKKNKNVANYMSEQEKK